MGRHMETAHGLQRCSVARLRLAPFFKLIQVLGEWPIPASFVPGDCVFDNQPVLTEDPVCILATGSSIKFKYLAGKDWRVGCALTQGELQLHTAIISNHQQSSAIISNHHSSTATYHLSSYPLYLEHGCMAVRTIRVSKVTSLLIFASKAQKRFPGNKATGKALRVQGPLRASFMDISS